MGDYRTFHVEGFEQLLRWGGFWRILPPIYSTFLHSVSKVSVCWGTPVKVLKWDAFGECSSVLVAAPVQMCTTLGNDYFRAVWSIWGDGIRKRFSSAFGGRERELELEALFHGLWHTVSRKITPHTYIHIFSLSLSHLHSFILQFAPHLPDTIQLFHHQVNPKSFWRLHYVFYVCMYFHGKWIFSHFVFL